MSCPDGISRHASHAPLSEVVGEGDVLEETVDDGLSLESGSRLLNLSNHFAKGEVEYVECGVVEVRGKAICSIFLGKFRRALLFASLAITQIM